MGANVPMDATHETADAPSLDAGPFRLGPAAWLVPVLLAFVAYHPSLSAGFVELDDYQYVVDNPLVREPGGESLWRFFAEVRRPSTVDGYYQPLTMASFLFESRCAFPDPPSAYVCHWSNVLLHALTTLLIALLLRMTVGGATTPLLLAALFALHPVHVESVAWIAQRKTVLSTPLALASVACYLRWGRSEKVGWAAATWLLYAAATLAKPTAVLLPLTFPLLDHWPLRRSVRRALPGKWPFAAWMIVIGWAAWVSQARTAGVAVPDVTGASVAQWPALISVNVATYARNLIWPTSLSPFVAAPTDLTFHNPVVVASLVVMLLLVGAWIAAARRSRPAFVGLTAAGILLSPALGGLRFMESCVGNRFLYLPMVFLLMIPAALVRPWVRAQPRRRVPALVLAGVIGLAWFSITRIQQRVWADSNALWTRVVQSAPAYGPAHRALAWTAYFDDDLPAALKHLDAALAFDANDSRSLHLLGRVRTRQGRYAEAEAAIRRALDIGLGVKQPGGHVSLAEALIAQGKDAAAEAALTKAVELGHEESVACAMIADTALRIARRPDAAARYYRRALAANPDDAAVRWNLGTALDADGRPAEALREYDAVLDAYARQGRSDPALEDAADRLRRRLESPTTQPPETQP